MSGNGSRIIGVKIIINKRHQRLISFFVETIVNIIVYLKKIILFSLKLCCTEVVGDSAAGVFFYIDETSMNQREERRLLINELLSKSCKQKVMNSIFSFNEKKEN